MERLATNIEVVADEPSQIRERPAQRAERVIGFGEEKL